MATVAVQRVVLRSDLMSPAACTRTNIFPFRFVVLVFYRDYRSCPGVVSKRSRIRSRETVEWIGFPSNVAVVLARNVRGDEIFLVLKYYEW